MFKQLALFALIAFARAQDDFDPVSTEEDCGENGELCDGGLQHHKYSRYLTFNEEGKFKIVNFSDLLISDNSDEWL